MKSNDPWLHRFIANRIKPGTRVNIDNVGTAHVVSLAEYQANASNFNKQWLDNQAGKHEYEQSRIVLIRWDMSGYYDWYWVNACQVLESWKLAQGAQNNADVDQV